MFPGFPEVTGIKQHYGQLNLYRTSHGPGLRPNCLCPQPPVAIRSVRSVWQCRAHPPWKDPVYSIYAVVDSRSSRLTSFLSH